MNSIKFNQVEDQANQLVSEAKKKLSPKGFFQSLFGYYRNRTEDAIECYQRAGNLFKLAKNWAQAASAFQLAGELHVECGNRVEAAHNFVLSSRCFEKYDIKTAINALISAIDIYTDLGRFTMAAKLHQTIGEIYEENIVLDNALRHYEQAADYFKVEENYNSAKKCLLKVAEYASGEFFEYEKAVEIYQDVAFNDLKNPILQYSAKETLLKALICHLAIDVLNAKHAAQVFIEKFPAFGMTREYEFIMKVIEQIEEENEDEYARLVKQFDEISRLSSWYTKLLLRIKKQINRHPDLL